MSLNSLQVINIFSVSFLTDAGKKIPSGVNLYKVFLIFFSKFKTLSTSISI